MAQNLQILRRRIKTAKSIIQVTRAMEMIAASKIKKAQKATIDNIPYTDKVRLMTLNMLSGIDSVRFSHPYIKTQEALVKMLIVISSDKGLCGSLNSNIFKKLLSQDHKETIFVAIGKKAERFLASLSFKIVASFPMGTILPPYGIIYPIKKIIDEYYTSGQVSEVVILHSEFRSIFSQESVFHKLLPIEPELGNHGSPQYIYEPSFQELLEELLSYYLEVTLYHAIIQAYTSEQAARMIAMQNAKNNATDIEEFLTLIYNKARQERITYELLDLANSQFAQN